MSTIAPFLFLGLLLGVLLAMWARRRPEFSSFETKDVSDPDRALEFLQFELLPPATVDSLFCRSDWSFVHKAASRRIQRLFLRERTTLALFWLGETRRQMSGLMRLHRRVARSLKDIRPETEAKLAIHYAGFLIGCDLLRLAVLVWGPFRVRGAVVHSASSARDLCVAFERFFTAYQDQPASLKTMGQSGL
jgi:hypothetical protein